MPAKSEKQKTFMRLVLAFKNGKISSSEVSKNVKLAAKSMTKDQIEDFVNNPIKKEMKLSSIMSDIYEENKSFIEEAEETISTIQQVKNKSFDDVLKENNGVPFDPKELSALQSKQINFGGTGKVKFILNKSKNEIKTEVFSNGTTKQCVIKKLVDNDTKNMYNYALFVQTIDENKKSSKIFYLLSGLFDNNDSDKIKTLTDFIDRFNSYGL